MTTLAPTHAPAPAGTAAPRTARPGRATDVWPDGVPKLEPITPPNLPPRVFEGDTRSGDHRDRRHALLILAVSTLVGGPAAWGLWVTGLADATTAVACGLAFITVALCLVALALCRQPLRHEVTFTIPEDGAR